MTNPDFNTILKAVSRSFYLSIRVLPNAMREPVAIAYLLARAADAIADTATTSIESRLLHLQQFKALLHTAETLPLDALIDTIDHQGERELLLQLPAVFSAYHNLSNKNISAVKNVVNTLTTGMEKDLQYFNDENNIKALPDDKTLDEYTYYVAGCVGEFWTELSIIHSKSLSRWQSPAEKQKILTLGIQFGKALQLTNILRDIAKDAKMNRCYLPDSDLKQYKLDTTMLMDEKNNAPFEPVIHKWLMKADEHFDAAQAYLLLIPRTSLRLRLASLWPILIGLSTLRLIREKQNFLDEDINVKVERKWVYKMLVLSIPVAFSNTALKYWIKKIKHGPFH